MHTPKKNWYCGWQPEIQITSWGRLVVSPSIYRVLYIPGGAGFLPPIVFLSSYSSYHLIPLHHHQEAVCSSSIARRDFSEKLPDGQREPPGPATPSSWCLKMEDVLQLVQCRHLQDGKTRRTQAKRIRFCGGHPTSSAARYRGSFCTSFDSSRVSKWKISSKVIRSPSACRQKLSVEALIISWSRYYPFPSPTPQKKALDMALLR